MANIDVFLNFLILVGMFSVQRHRILTTFLRILLIFTCAKSGVADEIGNWPRKVKPDRYDVEIVEENTEDRIFIYRTPHFEFWSDVKLQRKVVRAFSQIFESTLLAVQSLPLPWKPQAPKDGFYRTDIFETWEGYYSAGGPPGSGGVYFRNDRKIRVPLASLGVKKSSSGYTLDDDRKSSVLSHEITHQVTHRWLGRLPIWLVEGLAEYVEHVPYERGAFRFDRYDLDDVLIYENISMLNLESLMNLSHGEWNAAVSDGRAFQSSTNYQSAFLLQYFFNHCDLNGKRKPERMFRYLAAIEAGQSRADATKLLMAGRSYGELEGDVAAALKREGLDVTFR